MSGSTLEALTCGQAGSSRLRELLLVPETQQPVLQAYRDAMCGGAGGGQRSERFRQLSLELSEQINRQKVKPELPPCLAASAGVPDRLLSPSSSSCSSPGPGSRRATSGPC